MSIFKQNNDKLNAIFCVAGEAKPNNGEDSYYYSNKGDKTIVAVFDGCGGIGSKRYNNYSLKTGAYISSRAVCGGVKSWFDTASDDASKIGDYIREALDICEKYADKTGRLLGSLGKSFPTTAAIMYKNSDKITCMWAGDSRCYMLDFDGLCQLTEDDVDSFDALDNITSDGVLTNVISASADFEIHKKEFSVNKPCILFAATDGCFAYFNSPMEFEYLLTSSLVESENILEWQKKLNDTIKEVAGDDYSLSVCVFGFENFLKMKRDFKNRNIYVKNNFIVSDDDISKKWDLYKTNYSRYLNEK